MRKFLLLNLFLFFFLFQSFAQNQVNEKGFSFQGYARDFSGNALGGENIFVRFSIYPDGGADDFTEIHELETDAFGVFSAIVGSKNQAAFYTLDWVNKNYSLRVEVSTNNTDFVKISDTQLLSVPYAQVSSRAQNGVPAGTVLPFGGEVTTSLPKGFLPCDGRLVNINDYPELFQAIATNWGGDGSSNFRLPDLRGYFMRGVSDGQGNDPDRDARFSKAGSNSGDRVGSYQDDNTKSHNHGVTDPGHTHSYSDRYNPPSISDDADDRGVASNSTTTNSETTNRSTTGISINNTGGNETRPKNANVWYIIKY